MTRPAQHDSRPSVLLLSTKLSDGGAERVTSTLLQSFDREALAPSLCLLRDDVRYELPGDVPLHKLDYGGLPTLFRTARRLRRLIEETRPDVLLSNANATNFLAGFALRRCRHRTSWVARISGAPEHQDTGLRRLAGRWTYPRADRFVVNSEGLRTAMRKVYPFSATRLELIGNPVNFDRLESLANAPLGLPQVSGTLLVAVGRLSREKRYDLMLEALARIRDRVPASLWICGEGPERTRLEALVTSLGLGAAVRFLGFLDNPYPVMKRADLFVMTSDHEGLPNSLIEAQALGVPAISTRCPHGPDEIIDDEVTGLLTPVGDPAGIAEAIDRLLQQDERRAEMGRAGAQRMRRRFDGDVLSRRWEDLLLDLARAR